MLWVQVPYPNASPTETDAKIVRPIEAQFGTVPGIRKLTSRASSGSASFGVEFHGGVDMDEAYNAISDRLDRAMPDLPDEVERTFIYRFDPQDIPIMWAGVQLPEDVVDPYHLMTRVVQPRLERIPGVARVQVFGIPQLQVRVAFDKERSYAHGVDLGQVQRSLRSENFQMSSGQLTDRGLIRNARSIATLNDPNELPRFPIKEGVVLEDIADVGVGGAVSADINRINGEDSAGFIIQKEASANTVEVTERVKAALEELEESGRADGATFFVFFDQGELVNESVDTLTSTALTGGIFAIFVLYAFLREWKMTLLIATSIPFSLLITVGVIYFRGGTLNLISLMGLMLAVGMVVDNAIVVVETIYRRRADGAGVRNAAILGTAEVNLAIILSTATTMVVFLPVILMSDDQNFAVTMAELGLPVVFALAASLIVALIFAPLATRYMGKASIKPDPRWIQWMAGKYRTLLAATLKRRTDAAMTLLAMGMLTWGLAIPGVDCGGGAEGEPERLLDQLPGAPADGRPGARRGHPAVRAAGGRPLRRVGHQGLPDRAGLGRDLGLGRGLPALGRSDDPRSGDGRSAEAAPERYAGGALLGRMGSVPRRRWRRSAVDPADGPRRRSGHASGSGRRDRAPGRTHRRRAVGEPGPAERRCGRGPVGGRPRCGRQARGLGHADRADGGLGHALESADPDASGRPRDPRHQRIFGRGPRGSGHPAGLRGVVARDHGIGPHPQPDPHGSGQGSRHHPPRKPAYGHGSDDRASRRRADDARVRRGRRRPVGHGVPRAGTSGPRASNSTCRWATYPRCTSRCSSRSPSCSC